MKSRLICKRDYCVLFSPRPFSHKVGFTQFSHLVPLKSALIIFAIFESITFADDLMTLRGIRSETSNIDLIIQIIFSVLAPRKSNRPFYIFDNFFHHNFFEI